MMLSLHNMGMGDEEDGLQDERETRWMNKHVGIRDRIINEN